MELEKKFIKELYKLKLNKGHTCLLALSGGMDSISMLWLCSAVKELWTLSIYAARVMHNIRDMETEKRENRFCSIVCAEHSIPFEVLAITPGDIRHLDMETGCGIEAAARKLRYQKLREQAKKLSADVILTAHTADDQFETILMRIFSGSGPEGMAGIPQSNGIIRRPLLGIARENLRIYLGKKNGTWIEDETNALPIYTRNKIRKELFPLVRKIFPGWESALSTLSERVASSSKALDSIGQEKLPMIIDSSKRKWEAREWHLAPFYLQALALWHAFDDLHKGSNKVLPWAVVKSILLASKRHKNWRGYGLTLKHLEGMIVIEAMSAENMDYWDGILTLFRQDIMNGINFHIGSIHIQASLVEFNASRKYSVYMWPLIISFSIKEGSFRVRKVRDGLSMQRLAGSNSLRSVVTPGTKGKENLEPDISGESIYIAVSYHKEEKNV